MAPRPSPRSVTCGRWSNKTRASDAHTAAQLYEVGAARFVGRDAYALARRVLRSGGAHRALRIGRRNYATPCSPANRRSRSASSAPTMTRTDGWLLELGTRRSGRVIVNGYPHRRRRELVDATRRTVARNDVERRHVGRGRSDRTLAASGDLPVGARRPLATGASGIESSRPPAPGRRGPRARALRTSRTRTTNVRHQLANEYNELSFFPLGSEFVRGGDLMDASRSHGSRWHRRVRRVVATIGGVTSVVALGSTTAGASSRTTMTIATTSSTSGGVLVALGGGVLVLGIIGIVIFTWSRRKRRPDQCAEQREALALAERSRAVLGSGPGSFGGRSRMDVASDGTPHATLVAKAVEGLNSADETTRPVPVGSDPLHGERRARDTGESDAAAVAVLHSWIRRRVAGAARRLGLTRPISTNTRITSSAASSGERKVESMWTSGRSGTS